MHQQLERGIEGDEMSEDSDSDHIARSRRGKRPARVVSSGDSDTSSSSLGRKRPRKRIPLVGSDDSDSSASPASFVSRKVRPPRAIESGSDSDWEEISHSSSESDEEVIKPLGFAKSKYTSSSSSSSDDENSEKCPICLLKFKNQEIGSPETCDHMFCVECIQEWSKNVNTCPVDRQEFTLILVRKHLKGNVSRKITVEKRTAAAEVVEDLTFCEVCGQSDREDRMLLCDGCDLGFHMECLNPPLADIPMGEWYCSECYPRIAQSYEWMVDALGDNSIRNNLMDNPVRLRAVRLLPRTRQSERVRSTVENLRDQATLRNQQSLLLDPQPSTSSGFNSLTTQSNRRTPATRRRKTKRKPRRKTKRRAATATQEVYFKIDVNTGETYMVKQKTRKRRRRKKRKVLSRVPKTVKNRLASTLGICAPKMYKQTIPELKQTSSGGGDSINMRRHQAGIPTVRLFGQPNELDYFSDSDDEVIGGYGVSAISRTRSNILSNFRQSSLKSMALLSPPHAATPCDILDSILESQSKLLSKTSTLSVNRDGVVQIIDNRTSPQKSKTDRVNVNSSTEKGKETPGYPGYGSGNNNRPFGFNRGGNYNRSSGQGYGNYSNNNFYNSPRGGRGGFNSNNQFDSGRGYMDYINRGNQPFGGTPPFARGRGLPRFPRRGNFSGNQNPRNQNPNNYNVQDNEVSASAIEPDTSNQEDVNPEYDSQDLDIYSDIENRNECYESEPDSLPTLEPPPMPPALPDSDDNNSESNLEIDDAKTRDIYDPLNPSDSENENHDEANEGDGAQDGLVDSTSTVNVSADENLKNIDEHNELDTTPTVDENVAEDMDCPNFSIYSNETVAIAKEMDDLTRIPDDITDVGTPLIDEEIPMPEDSDEKINEDVAKSEMETENSTAKQKAPIKIDFNMKRQSSGLKCLQLYDDSDYEDILDDKDDQEVSALTNDQLDVVAETAETSTPQRDMERSYTPCLDEKDNLDGSEEPIADLGTEMVSEDERNDFEDVNDHDKTISDSDALEINARGDEVALSLKTNDDEDLKDKDKPKKSSDKNKDGDAKEKDARNVAFNKKDKTKIKDRNYRDKDRSRSRSKDNKKDKSKKERKRDKKRELERYDVRNVVGQRVLKDKFGRDRSRSPARTPSPKFRKSPNKRSSSPTKSIEFQGRRSVSSFRSLGYRSRSRSPKSNKRRSHSRGKRKSLSQTRRSRSPSKKRKRSRSRSRSRKNYPRSKLRRRSMSRKKDKHRKSRSRSRERKRGDKKKVPQRRSPSPRYRSTSPVKRRIEALDWDARGFRREWSRSPNDHPILDERLVEGSPSWTPPLTTLASPTNFTVYLRNNDNVNRKKKEKKRKTEKRAKELEKQKKRRRDETTVAPSKEVFASGNNILVSLSFQNKEAETHAPETIREVVTSKRKRDNNENEQPRKKKKEKKKDGKKKKKSQKLLNVKPVAIIDLENSPFKELTPSPRDIIVLSDSDHAEKEETQKVDAKQNGKNDRVENSAPDSPMEYNAGGPKTPPEPQIKFLIQKPTQLLQNVVNPLHEEHEEEEQEEDADVPSDIRINDGVHKGPNTPPDPPNSPPSSPDAYDPFEPTKSRTPTPPPAKHDETERSPQRGKTQTPEKKNRESREKQLAQTNDSDNLTNSPKQATTPTPGDNESKDSIATPSVDTPGKSSDKNAAIEASPISVIINRQVQPVGKQTPNNASNVIVIPSTPPPQSQVQSSRSNYQTKRTTPQKSTAGSKSNKQVEYIPTKIPKSNPASKQSIITKLPMPPAKTQNNTARNKRANYLKQQRALNNNDKELEIINIDLDFDSPYSPGSSDFDDLFEPPSGSNRNSGNKLTKANNSRLSPLKAQQNVFDSLFGELSPKTSAARKLTTPIKSSTTMKVPVKFNKKKGTSKTIAASKIDEDNLKVLDDLPSSAVELQVKDKFLKKLNRQERVVEEVKLVLKPHYNKKHVTKEQYKDILRRAVPKICHNKTGEINPKKIQNLVEAYVKKYRSSNKKSSAGTHLMLPAKPAKTTFWS